MAKRSEVYKCFQCGNVIEVLTGADGDLVCCGEEMKLLKENTVDAAKEKHVPVVTTQDNGMLVNVGSVDHPMTDDHFIEWIEVIAGDTTYTTFLKPGDKPQACFPKLECDFTVREHCNLHGLWKV
ncbi:MAG: desulfoferrodoxin [Desulfocapsaceae bacterium]|nr:desulfoferrodoxin [Desulfocapsaceae bacterium]